MKLEIRQNNESLLLKVAKSLGDSTPTSALNFILEKAGPIVLEQIEAMQIEGRSNASAEAPIVPPMSTPERRVYVPELDGTAVESAFD